MKKSAGIWHLCCMFGRKHVHVFEKHADVFGNTCGYKKEEGLSQAPLPFFCKKKIHTSPILFFLHFAFYFVGVSVTGMRHLTTDKSLKVTVAITCSSKVSLRVVPPLNQTTWPSALTSNLAFSPKLLVNVL